ncbi:MAG: class I SAM-dependent methyltransferase [Legionellales bacterium]|nr:class I SAM-dependent methyltransferase [Legionellales bacterium]
MNSSNPRSCLRRHPASFRDPTGSIFEKDGMILRGLTESGLKRYEEARNSGFLNHLEAQQKMVKTENINIHPSDSKFVTFVQHEKIPFISYPYEWPFLLLKEAALFHLNLQIEALASDYVLTDATAYNVQFQGVSPIFIDLLSFRRYLPGELWKGHRQFCEQFLNPLLLVAMKGIPYHAWYRGAMEGIPTELMARWMPLRSWFSLRSLTHILWPALSERSRKNEASRIECIQQTTFPKEGYRYLLKQLYHWILYLKPKHYHLTEWADYEYRAPYEPEEWGLKKKFIANFSAQTNPFCLLDLGCNTGEFSELALAHGASRVIGVDSDAGALHQAVLRAQQKKLNFLPLYQELSNPSPSQGWLLQERDGFPRRGVFDAVIALALIHHLIIGNHLDFSEAMGWILSLAPAGVIEFIPKTDPCVQKMLALREDVFSNYSEDIFVALLEAKADIIHREVVSMSGRCLYWYHIR